METNIITEKEIKKILMEKYQGKRETPDRKLHRNINNDCYSNVGSIIYSLDGSPPKGYALVIPELKVVNYYDHKGEMFFDMFETKVEELIDLVY